MKRFVLVFAVLLACVPFSVSVSFAVCPNTLNAVDPDQWYESDPPFSGENTIHMVVDIRNDYEGPLEFSGTGSGIVQLWSVPGATDLIPLTTFNAVPSGTVPAGETFTYDLTIDVSGLPPSEQRIAFRPVSVNQGTITPRRVTLTSATFACQGPEPAAAIPTLNGWGMVLFIVLIGTGAIYYLRGQRRVSS
jgi:hypothetical protein